MPQPPAPENDNLHAKLLSSGPSTDIHIFLSRQLGFLQKALDLNYELTKKVGIEAHDDGDITSRNLQDGLQLHRENCEGSFPLVCSPLVALPLQNSSTLSIPNMPQPKAIGTHHRTASFLEPVETNSGRPRSNSVGSSEEASFKPKVGKSSKNSHHSIMGDVVSHYLFPDSQDLKASIEEALKTPAYNVEDYYYESGFWQAAAKNEQFGNFIMSCIIFNTIWMAIDIDYNKADVLCDAPLFCQIADHSFTAIFAAEIIVRFMAFQSKVQAFKEIGFVTDGVLVLLMIWENWIMVALYLMAPSHPQQPFGTSFFRIFRAFRLLRIARAARMFNSIPELLILVKSMTVAVRSTLSILVLLVLVIYLFALVFTQLLSEAAVGTGKFDTVPQSMNFLLLSVLCGFDADYISELLAASVFFYMLFLLFLFVSSLTIMNMLVALLCDVVSSASESENTMVFEQDLKSWMDDVIVNDADTNHSNTIDRHEFDAIVKSPKMVKHLDALGVDVVSVAEVADYIFSKVDELSLADFAHLMGQYRGCQQAKVQDMMDMRKFLFFELLVVQESLKSHVESVVEARVCRLSQDQSSHEASSFGLNVPEMRFPNALAAPKSALA